MFSQIIFFNNETNITGKEWQELCNKEYFDALIELDVKPNVRKAKKQVTTVCYFDDKLYDENRYTLEQTNAWMIL